MDEAVSCEFGLGDFVVEEDNLRSVRCQRRFLFGSATGGERTK